MTQSSRSMRSLRRRLTAVATLTVGVVLAATAILLVGLQHRQLLADVDTALERRADELALLIADGVPTALPDTSLEDSAAQLVSVDGVVVAATSNLAGEDPIAPAPAEAQTIRTVDDVPVDDDDFRLLSRRTDVGDEALVLHVAENIDDIDEGVAALTTSLLIAFPIVLAVLAALTWTLVGRTLRPVERAARRQEQFVGDASHELRSPLARIRTRLEVDLAHPVNLRDTATAVLDETQAMERLVDDLLHLASADATGPDRRRRARRPVDLDDIVLREAQALRAARNTVTVDASAVSGGLVRGEPADLTRLVRNLLDNAGRHAAGVVTLSLVEHEDAVVLTVDDDGPGVPADQRLDVFERFTRVDAPRSPLDGGTGLGLAIARDIVVAHGGGITVTDAPNGGARFVVTLPRG